MAARLFRRLGTARGWPFMGAGRRLGEAAAPFEELLVGRRGRERARLRRFDRTDPDVQ